MEVAIIADDLTGAADSGIQLTRAGYKTAVAFRGAPIPPAEGLDATVVDTDSRLLECKEARKRVLDAGRPFENARMVYKKMDSTLRGPFATELGAALDATGRSKAVVAPAFPSAGRSTRGGVQMLHGEPVHETGLADDPHTPVKESHVPSILEEAGFEDVYTLGIEDLEAPDTIHQALAVARWLVVDAEEDAHLEALVEAVRDPSEVLWCGSAGLALALGRIYPGPHVEDDPGSESLTARRVLMVVGSTNEVVREQLRCVANESEIMLVPFDSHSVADGRPEEAIREAFEGARKALGESRSTVLYTTVEKNLGSGGAGRLIEGVSEVVARLSEENLFDALVLTGGDTAVHVARALGAQGILLEKELEAGVPIGTLIGPKPYPVVTKAGGFGEPDTLLKALRTLTGKE